MVVLLDMTRQAETTVGHQSDNTRSRMTRITANMGIQGWCVCGQHLIAQVAEATRPVADMVILVAIATVGRGRDDSQGHAGDMA